MVESRHFAPVFSLKKFAKCLFAKLSRKLQWRATTTLETNFVGRRKLSMPGGRRRLAVVL